MPTIVTGTGDSHISIPAGSFDDKLIIGGGGASAGEPINLGGEPEAPGDRFGTSSPAEPEPPVEPKPENPKLKEAIQNRDKLYVELDKYQDKTINTLKAKNIAKADMEAKKAAMQEAKNLRDEAKKAVEEAKKVVSNPSSTEEAGKALGDVKIALDAANTKYTKAVKSYNASVKTFNKYITLCLKRDKKLFSLKKSFNKAEEKVSKLGGEALRVPFETSSFKSGQEALKNEKVLTGMGKYTKNIGKYAKTGGKAGAIAAVCIGAAFVAADAIWTMINDDVKFGDASKNAAKDLGLISDTEPSETESVSQAVVSNPSVDDAGDDAKVETPIESGDNTQKVDDTGAVADENAAETGDVDNPNAAEQGQGTAAAGGASVVDEAPAEEVDEAKVEEEIAQEESEPLVEVREGDNLWKICKRELTEKNGEKPTNAEIAARVGEVMEKNGLHYESDGYRVLIYPKQKLKM